MKSLLYLISISLVPLTANSIEELKPNQHYEYAKEAYDNNACRVAIYHFKVYLNVSAGNAKHHNRILKAIDWCEKFRDRERSFSSISAGITGPRKPFVPLLSDVYEHESK